MHAHILLHRIAFPLIIIIIAQVKLEEKLRSIVLDVSERLGRKGVTSAIERKKVSTFHSQHHAETDKVRALVDQRLQADRDVELQAEAKITEEVRVRKQGRKEERKESVMERGSETHPIQLLMSCS